MLSNDNTIGDIQGVIYCLQSDIHESAPEFPVEPRFAEVIERIEDKIARNRNEIRKNWFTEALDQAKRAQGEFAVGKPDYAERALQKCLDGITDGNKAHRRKTDFIVAPDGSTSQAQ